jgi:hypothetical protein
MNVESAPSEVEFGHANVDFVDSFADDRRRGRVVGTSPCPGVVRGGIDVERIISIDHGALRIRPLLQSGWGRAKVSYGPYQRRDGLMLAVLMLNGHNTSQSEKLPESLPKRLGRWLQGHGDRRFGLVHRAWQWLRYNRKRYMIRRLRWWWRMAFGSVDEFDENLAVGWFDSDVQRDPSNGGNSFVMHAALGNNGELWVRSASGLLPVTGGVQNLPMCYVVVLRERGAAYYVASVPDAYAVGTLPRVRPLAIDPFGDDPVVYAGVHQSALGQIGFRVDTRVYAVQVEHVAALAEWYGTAHVADTLVGDAPLDGSSADVGGPWSVSDGTFQRSGDGTVSRGLSNVAVVWPAEPSGLVHAVIEVGSSGDGEFGLVWRRDRDGNCYRFVVDHTSCRVVLHLAGTTAVLATADVTAVRAGDANSLQVIDHGATATLAVNGHDVFHGAVTTEHLANATGTGICASGSQTRFTSFEAHPVDVDLDGILKLPAPWFPTADLTVASDDLNGATGLDLDGQRTPVGDKVWHRQYGKGRILTTGSAGAAVDASTDRPNPGNLAYTIDWDHRELADVAVDITPPGSADNQGQRGRGGLVFWQDPKNFLMVSMFLDDSYDGASIAIFSHLDGFEEIYDAVWSMVGTKIYYGVPHRLRVVSDGMNFMTFIDGEPVLYRALTDIYVDRGPLLLNRVGLAVNWEWGDDTGTAFANFVANTGRSQL